MSLRRFESSEMRHRSDAQDHHFWGNVFAHFHNREKGGGNNAILNECNCFSRIRPLPSHQRPASFCDMGVATAPPTSPRTGDDADTK